jgi:two-component system, OmpR family, KDP operon response regulator KdpE
MSVGGIMKILVIDDDVAMTELLKLLLQPTATKIFTCNSGREGIELCKEISPDIIILDFMMPEIDGATAVKIIRTFSDTPIIILSALDNPGIIVQALDAGADDYLIKPVPSSVLIAHIRTLLRRANIELGALMKCPI